MKTGQFIAGVLTAVYVLSSMSVDYLACQDPTVISTEDLLYDRSIICETSYRVYGLKSIFLIVCSQKQGSNKGDFYAEI